MLPHQELRQHILKGVVLTPGDRGYAESLDRWSLAAIKNAGVVVQADNAEEVSLAVRYATSRRLPLVVLGGGHSTSGASSSEGGLVIDLRRLCAVQVDAGARAVTFGGGCRWEDVDRECARLGLATVGGTVNDTGVGGLILGGGYGWLSSRYGLAVDNLMQAEVVLADGRIVQASSSVNDDLFWALRGAGQNFGVVTSFTCRVYPQGDVWAGPLLFSLDKMPQVVSYANWFHENNTGDESFWFGALGGAPGLPMPVLFCMLFKNTTRAQDGESFFKPLLDLGPMANLVKVIPYPQANALMPHRHERKRRLLGGANFTMPLDGDFVETAVKEMLPFISENRMGEGSGILFEMFPNRKIREVPQSDTAFPSRGPFYHVALSYAWDDASLDQRIRSFNKGIIALFHQRGFQGGGGQYNNYDGNYLDPAKAFGSNLPRLQILKVKYDPDNIFSKWHSVWPTQAGSTEQIGARTTTDLGHSSIEAASCGLEVPKDSISLGQY